MSAPRAGECRDSSSSPDSRPPGRGERPQPPITSDQRRSDGASLPRFPAEHRFGEHLPRALTALPTRLLAGAIVRLTSLARRRRSPRPEGQTLTPMRSTAGEPGLRGSVRCAIEADSARAVQETRSKASRRTATGHGEQRDERRRGAQGTMRFATRFTVIGATMAGLLLAGPGLAVGNEITLVRNNNQGPSYQDSNLTRCYAQRFETGSNATGYDISRVQVRLGGEETGTASDLEVSLHEANGSNPGTQIATLDSPSSIGAGYGNKTFTVLSNETVRLGKSTQYFIKVDPQGNWKLKLEGTGNSSQSGASGWKIDNTGRESGNNSCDSWGNWGTTGSSKTIMKIRIYGTVNPAINKPKNVTLGASGSTHTRLKWYPPEDRDDSEYTGYTIRRATTSSGPWTTMAEHIARTDGVYTDGIVHAQYYRDHSVEAGTRYYYQVAGVNKDADYGGLDWSSTADVQVPRPPQPTPGGALEFGATRIELAKNQAKSFTTPPLTAAAQYRLAIQGAGYNRRVIVTDGGDTEVANFGVGHAADLLPRFTAGQSGAHTITIARGDDRGRDNGLIRLVPATDDAWNQPVSVGSTTGGTFNTYGDVDRIGLLVQPGKAYAVRVRGRSGDDTDYGTAETPRIKRAMPPSTTHVYNMGKPWVDGVTIAKASPLCHNFLEPDKCEFQAFVIDLRGQTGAEQTWHIIVAPTQRPDTRPYRVGTYSVLLDELSATDLAGVRMPLRAWFASQPAQHDGSKAIKVRVAFSDAVDESPEQGVEVEGGEVTSVRSTTRSLGGRNAGQDDREVVWEFEIEPASNGDVTVSFEAGRPCDEEGAICTADGRSLAQGIATTVEGPDTGPPPLTARVARAPAAHNGRMAFTLRLAFSEPIRMSGWRLRAEVVAVAGGRVTKARPVKGRKDLWALTVKPASRADVTVTLAGGAACDTPAAVCTKDGRALSHTLATTVRGPVALSVADARAEEGTDETLDFAVSLSRAASRPVRVAYATADGTARAGADYTRTRGTLRFAPGETVKTVRVPVLDDAHDEGEETLTLRLSKAFRARLADRVATGTIENADPLQRAWLARFGRTAATHVTDAVGDRLRGTPGQESHVTVGGYRLPVGQRGATDGADDGVSGVERLVLALGQRLGLGTGPAPAGAGGVAGAGGWPDAPVATDPRLGQSRTLDVGNALNLRQVLLGSSFRLALGGDAVGSSRLRLTAWGRVAGTTFDGRDGKVSLDGDVLTGTVGVDGEWDRLLAGLAVAHSRGDGSYTMPVAGGDDSGNLEQTLTSVHPYLRYAVNDRLDVWGLFGYGWGELDLEMDNDEPLETDTTLVMGAFGGRGILLAAPESGGFQLATRTDAMLTRTTSEAVMSANGNLAGAEADAHRLRLVLEGSRGFAWAEGRSLTPTMEVGLRHDWGDAETGFGLELGGRVQYADPALGLTIDATVRGLLAHEDDDYQEWGASGTVRINPGATGQGLSLTLAPAWGAASSGVNGLWSRQTTAGLAPQGTRQTPAGRLNAEVGYGFTPFGAGLLTPYAGTVLSDGAARTYRVGGRLQLTGGWATGLTLSLEGQRQEPAGQQPATQGLRLQATWGF